MPITPLHLGLLATTSRLKRNAPSVKAFIIANVLADVPVVLNIYAVRVEELGGPALGHTLHATITHTFAGALLLGLVLSLFKIKSPHWWSGCFFGALSHVALDMFVHADVKPFAPLSDWNPFYFEAAHAWLSVFLSIGLVWWILQLLDQRKADRPT